MNSVIYSGPRGQKLVGTVETDPRGLSAPLVAFVIAGHTVRFQAAGLAINGWNVDHEEQ